MFCDLFGNEFKVGQIVGVSRYGKYSKLSYGIITSAERPKKKAFLKFQTARNHSYGPTAARWIFSSNKAEIGEGINDNIVILQVPESNEYNQEIIECLNEVSRDLIQTKILPADYILGQDIGTEEEGLDVFAEERADEPTITKPLKAEASSILSSMGTPESLKR